MRPLLFVGTNFTALVIAIFSHSAGVSGEKKSAIPDPETSSPGLLINKFQRSAEMVWSKPT